MVNKAVFLDRDGVINHDPDDYTYLLSETTILPGIIEFAQKVKEKGYLLIVITNQGGINKGRYTKSDVEAVNDYIQSEFKQDADGSGGASRWAIGTLSTAYTDNGKMSGSGSGSFERLEITTSEREAEEGYAKNVSPKYFVY